MTLDLTDYFKDKKGALAYFEDAILNANRPAKIIMTKKDT